MFYDDEVNLARRAMDINVQIIKPRERPNKAWINVVDQDIIAC